MPSSSSSRPLVLNPAAGLLLLLAALIAANAPFVSRRKLLFLGGGRQDKHGWWRVLELVLCYLLILALARLLEARAGEIYRQGWEFYAVTVSIFLLLGFPGFVYRYLRRDREERHSGDENR